MKKKNPRKSAGSKSRLPFRKIGFVVKHRQPEAETLAIELAEFSLKKGAEIAFLTENTALTHHFSGSPGVIAVKERTKIVAHCDLIVVLGGDGTFLSVARLMKSRSVPVLGVNMGQLGFLTEIKRGEAMQTLSDLLKGKTPLISERALFEVTLRRADKVIFRGPVVNDAVISKGAIARIIGLEVSVNGKWAHNVRSDGIIVSTPTGSTAYSLAAGGPIVEPKLGAMILSPICPHSLTQRPLVVSDTSEIQIRLSDRPGHVLLTLDGQDAVDMKERDVVTVRRFRRHSLAMISSPGRNYFSLLREKLKFGMRD